MNFKKAVLEQYVLMSSIHVKYIPCTKLVSWLILQRANLAKAY